KKNSKNFIIPASYFIKKGIKPVPVTIPEKQQTSIQEPKQETYNKPVPSHATTQVKVEKTVSETKAETPKISLNSGKKATSGLSLKINIEKYEYLNMQIKVDIN